MKSNWDSTSTMWIWFFSSACVWLMARGPNAPEGRGCVGKEEIGTALRARYVQIPDVRWEETHHWVYDDTKANLAYEAGLWS